MPTPEREQQISQKELTALLGKVFSSIKITEALMKTSMSEVKSRVRNIEIMLDKMVVNQKHLFTKSFYLLGEKLRVMSGFMSKQFRSMMNFLTEKTGAKYLFSTLWGGVKKIATLLGLALVVAFGVKTGVFKKVFNWLTSGGWFQSLMGWLKGSWKFLTELLPLMYDATIKLAKWIVGPLWTWLSGPFWGWVMDKFAPFLQNTLYGMLEWLTGTFYTWAKGFYNLLEDDVKPLLKWFRDDFYKWFRYDFYVNMKTLYESLNAFLTPLFNWLTGPLWKWVSGPFKFLLEFAFNKILAWVTDDIWPFLSGTLWPWLKDFKTWLVNYLLGYFNIDVLPYIKQVIDLLPQFKDMIASIINEPFKWAKAWAASRIGVGLGLGAEKKEEITGSKLLTPENYEQSVINKMHDWTADMGVDGPLTTDLQERMLQTINDELAETFLVKNFNSNLEKDGKYDFNHKYDARNLLDKFLKGAQRGYTGGGIDAVVGKFPDYESLSIGVDKITTKMNNNMVVLGVLNDIVMSDMPTIDLTPQVEALSTAWTNVGISLDRLPVPPKEIVDTFVKVFDSFADLYNKTGPGFNAWFNELGNVANTYNALSPIDLPGADPKNTLEGVKAELMNVVNYVNGSLTPDEIRRGVTVEQKKIDTLQKTLEGVATLIMGVLKTLNERIVGGVNDINGNLDKEQQMFAKFLDHRTQPK